MAQGTNGEERSQALERPLVSTSPVDSDPITSEPPVEEIVVVGDRTLRSLTEELRRAEDYVHERFNALNDDDQFDIHCHRETRTGTNISRRVCKANYVDSATAVEAQANLASLRGEFGVSQMSPRATIQYKNRILREKLTEFVNEDAQLRESVTHFAELRENYENAKRQILDSGE